MQKSTEAYKLWRSYLQHLSRLSRFTLGVKIDNLFTDFIELILLAGYADRSHKAPLVQRASSKLDLLKFFLQLAWETQLLDKTKYIAFSKPLDEVGKMLGGWRKQIQASAHAAETH